MKRICALCALFVLVLAGCGKEVTTTTEPAVTKEPPKNPQSEVLTQAEQAGLLPPDEDKGLTEEDAHARVTETLDADAYKAELTDETLQVGKDEKNRHDYYVFEVKDAEGAAVGRVAVDQQTGEKYNYLGDGVLDDYATFPLYDPKADAVCDWEGSYMGPAKVTLEILQGDSSSFEFLFSDGTGGNAKISGNTAKSLDGEINFLFAEEIITVAGGGLTGNYTAQ